jgi:TolB-like protein
MGIQRNPNEPPPSGPYISGSQVATPPRQIRVATGEHLLRPPRSRGLSLIVLVLFFLLALGGGLAYLWYQQNRAEASVAVLPFLAPEGFQHEAERFTTEITRKLTGSSRLTVADPGQVSRVRLQGDAQAAGRQLGVKAVLTGELRRSERGITLVVKLTRVEDGRMLAHFDTGEVSVDAVQVELERWSNEVVKRVRKALQGSDK